MNRRIELPAEDLKKQASERRARLTVASIQERYRWATFESDLLPKRVSPLAAIAKAKGAVRAPSVVFLGGAGTGKTSLACALLRHIAAANGVRGLFASAFSLAKARQEHRLGDGEAPLIEQAIDVKLLLLDELGAEFVKNTAVQEVIHERHAHERQTIYTSGFEPEELAQRYGDGIARRIFENATKITLK